MNQMGQCKRMLRSCTLFSDGRSEAPRGRVGAAGASEPLLSAHTPSPPPRALGCPLSQCHVSPGASLPQNHKARRGWKAPGGTGLRAAEHGVSLVSGGDPRPQGKKRGRLRESRGERHPDDTSGWNSKASNLVSSARRSGWKENMAPERLSTRFQAKETF